MSGAYLGGGLWGPWLSVINKGVPKQKKKEEKEREGGGMRATFFNFAPGRQN